MQNAQCKTQNDPRIMTLCVDIFTISNILYLYIDIEDIRYYRRSAPAKYFFMGT